MKCISVQQAEVLTDMSLVLASNRHKCLVAAMPQGIARYFERQNMLRILPLEKTVNFGEVLLFTNKRLVYSPNAALIAQACALMQQKTAFKLYRHQEVHHGDRARRAEPEGVRNC